MHSYLLSNISLLLCKYLCIVHYNRRLVAERKVDLKKKLFSLKDKSILAFGVFSQTYNAS